MFGTQINRILAGHDILCRAYLISIQPLIYRIAGLRSAKFRSQVLARNGNNRFASRAVDTGVNMVLDLTNRVDLEMLMEMDSKGLYELGTTLLIRRLLRPGGTFVDVGANSGYFTLIGAAQVGNQGHVYAFEPFPGAIQRLERNVRLNRASNVIVVPEAAFREDAELVLQISNVHDGMNTIVGTGMSRGMKVKATTLDSELPDKQIGLVKIDVEGAEKSVLEGMRGVLSQGKCLWVVLEWRPPAQVDTGVWEASFQYFRSLGTLYLIQELLGSWALAGPVESRKELPLSGNLLLVPNYRRKMQAGLDSSLGQTSSEENA